MADRYCRIFLNKHHGSRFTNYKTSSDNNRFFACAVDSIVIKDLHACLRCTWRESDLLACKYTRHGKICHTVNILLCCKCILDHCLIQMFWQRTEQKNSMDLVIFVYFIDGCKKLILGNILRKKNFLTCNTKSLTALCSTSLIGNIAWILTNTDNTKCRIYTFCLKLCNVRFDLFIESRCYFFT